MPVWGQSLATGGGGAAEPTGPATNHKLMLCTNGALTGWGDNQSGQLGSGSGFVATPAPVSVSLPGPAVKVVATFTSSFAILADGSLWAWGGNDFGQLGVGSGIASTTTALQVPTITHVVAVAGHLYHTIALCADGTVWSWGNNRFGALGTGGTGTVYTPQQIPPSTLGNIRAIASDAMFCLALDANGHIWSWGQDNAGALGTGLPVTGSPLQPTPTRLPLNNVRQIDLVQNRAVALCSDGTVWTWGENAAGHLGLGLNNTAYTNTPTQVGAGLITDAVWVAMNDDATIAVRPSGATYAWGSNVHGCLGASAPGFAAVPVAGPRFSPNAQLDGQARVFTCTERTGTVKTWGLFPLGYSPVSPLPSGASDVPTTPPGMGLAVPAADFPRYGPLRAYYLNPADTYVAAQHGYTVSPAEVGDFGRLTVVDASRPPYNGTVVFDGVYHLRGDVQFINGSFEARPGTVFYVNGLSGRITDSQLTMLEMQRGTLLLANTELRAQGDMPWYGIALTQGSTLRTLGAGRFQQRRSIIRDAWIGVHNTEDSHYYLSATDFIDNSVGVMDAPRTSVLAGEGVRACRFVHNSTTARPGTTGTLGYLGYVGLYFYDTADSQGQNYYGDFGNAVFADNTFTGLQVGISGTAGNATIRDSQFTNCWYAAAYSWGMPNSPEAVRAGRPTLPMIFQNNTFTIPANFPPGYSTTPNTVAYGINARTGHELRNNAFTVAPTSVVGVASRRVGAALRYQGVALRNTFAGLDAGIEAVSGEWYMPTTYDFQQNTFTDNAEGVSFLPPGYTLGNSGTVTMRCNTLSSSVAGATGIWVKPNTVFPATMGSSSLPNGNRFDGSAFAGTGAASRLLYNGYNASGSFTYSSYNSGQEFFSSTAPTTLTVGAAQVDVSSVPGSASNCGGSAQPGVYARVQPVLLTAAGLRSRQDSLREKALPASRQQVLLMEVLGYYRQTQQYDGLDAYTQTVSGARPAVAIAGSLVLLHAYQQIGRHADVERLRANLGLLARHDAALLNFLRVWDAERQLRFAPPAPGRKVIEPAGQLLRLAAASGTLAARPACQLLQLYEPNCRCVLPTVSPPALSRRQGAALTPAFLLESAYPNPANEAVTVRYGLPRNGMPATLAITDALGRPVLTHALNREATETTFSVRTLPTGLYHMTLLHGGKGQATRKLAVVR